MTLSERHPRAARLRSTLVGVFLVASAAAEGQGPAVRAVRVDGSSVAGELVGCDERAVRLRPADGQGRTTELATDGLLSVEMAEAAAPTEASVILEFANGDRLAVAAVSFDDDTLSGTFGGAPLSVPLECLRAIVFVPLNVEDGTAALLFRHEGGDDLVLLTNGDRLAGQVVGLSATELRLDVDDRDTGVPRERVAAVSFSPELTQPATIEGPRQVVQSSSGWLTVGGLARADDGSWRGQAAFGGPVVWPSGSVGTVRFFGDDVVPLSALDPSATEVTPYLGPPVGPRVGRAVTGEPLEAGGRVFPIGVGVHSRTRLTYRLGGGQVAFRAVAGLSGSAGAVGSAEFAVEVDGREVFRSGPVGSADSVPVAVDLTGAETLILTVDYGRNGDVLDRANWCDALLVRAPSGRQRNASE